MVVYTLEQRDRLTEYADFGKKNYLFRWSSFWSWRVCKQTKLSHLGHRKSARIHWKAAASKTSHYFVRILVQRHSWDIFFENEPLQSIAIVIAPCWTDICSQNLKRRILVTFTCHTIEATLDVLRLVFEDHIISRRADVWPPRSCDLSPLDYYLEGAVKDKCYADKPETIDALKDYIREAIGEIQLHTNDNVLKIWTDRVGYCMASRGSHLVEIIFHY